MDLRINYDKTVDALNIALCTGAVSKTLEIAPEIYVDVDKKGRTLNIEIIGAKGKIGTRNLSAITIGNKSIALPTFA